jgi:tRNA threonylcarbamoyladenosine biosynthesis protein TsaB
VRVLVLATALDDAFAALVEGDRIIAQARTPGGRGLVERLPELAGTVIEGRPDLIAVLVGPGSFTGIRAGLALAEGLAVGFGCPVVGVTVGEAVAAGVGRDLRHGGLRVATDARRGTVFLEGDGPPRSVALSELDAPGRPVLAGGDAADALLDRLRSLGVAATPAEPALPGPVSIARTARDRIAGRLAPLEVLPLYVDPPEVSRAAAPARPAPA